MRRAMLEPGETDRAKRLRHDRGDLGVGPAPRARTECDLLPDRQADELVVRVAEHDADPLANLRDRLL